VTPSRDPSSDAVDAPPIDRDVEDVMATDGRVIGRRAIQTRRRILDATASLLRQQGALDVKVIDVAREVGASPATFYQYFADVEGAILALATEAVAGAGAFAERLGADWSGPDGLDEARRLVHDYMDFWSEHQAVLRIMHLRADERDPRFRAVRVSYNEPLLWAMEAKVKEAQAAGRLPLDLAPFATAGAMLAVLDRLTSFRETFERRGTSRAAMEATVARILHTALTGG
jgi:AcrR family transcriptional regulator